MLPRHHAGKFTEFNFTDSSSNFSARRFDSFTGAFVRSEMCLPWFASVLYSKKTYAGAVMVHLSERNCNVAAR